MSRFMLYLGALALGVAAGLLATWYVFPVRYVDTEPHTLNAASKTMALKLIVEAYTAEGDVERARERLLTLGEVDPARTLTALAQRTAADGGNAQSVQAIANLAVMLGGRPLIPTSVAVITKEAPTPELASSETPAPTDTPPPTITPIPLPTVQPSPTPVGSFVIASQQVICDPTLRTPRLQVITQDSQGNPVAGVEVRVEWNEGRNRDHFFTGLKPEFGLGYGDFEMQSDITYSVRLALGTTVATTALSHTLYH